jgi:arginine deiminase
MGPQGPARNLTGVQVAEWDRPVLALMHTPNDGGELIVSGLHAPSSLFETAFDPDLAAADHRGFIEMLTEVGVKVMTVRQALLRGTEEEGTALTRLRNLALDSVTLDASAFPEEFRETEIDRLIDSIAAYAPEQLFNVIATRPTIRLFPTKTNTGYDAAYSIDPIMNLMFMRDQSLTTAAGRVISNLNSVQRESEIKVVRAVLEAIGQPPIYEVKSPGRIEGGDFFPAGEFALVGMGLRTNFDAIRQIMDADAFGCRFVVVVKDAWSDQEEMHLDTYFNIINESLAVMVQPRLDAKPGDKMYTVCDVYERQDSTRNRAGLVGRDRSVTHRVMSSSVRGSSVPGSARTRSATGDRFANPRSFESHVPSAATTSSQEASEQQPKFYERVEHDVPFPAFLRRIGYSIISVPKADQLIYGCNFVTISPTEILLVKRDQGVSQGFRDALAAHGVRFREVEMSALTKGYGAAHCTTQFTRVPYWY